MNPDDSAVIEVIDSMASNRNQGLSFRPCRAKAAISCKVALGQLELRLFR